jgi:hypothetical protein
MNAPGDLPGRSTLNSTMTALPPQMSSCILPQALPWSNASRISLTPLWMSGSPQWSADVARVCLSSETDTGRNSGYESDQPLLITSFHFKYRLRGKNRQDSSFQIMIHEH